MTKVKTPPVKSFQPLDNEERAMMDSLEQAIKSDKLPSNELTPKRLAALQRSAKATRKEQRTAISIRLRSTDLTKIKARAERKDVPYQTLIQSIIHQYVSGDLVEKL